MNALDIIEKAALAALATDQKNRILALNAAARDLLGFGEDEDPVGEDLLEYLDARDIFGNRLSGEPIAIWDMITQGEPVRTFQLSVRRGSDDRTQVSVAVVVVLNPEPESYHLVYLLRPILQRRKADEVIERILSSPTDGGLPGVARSLNGDSGEVTDLTRRQIEVLRLLARGSTVEEISSHLEVSVHTVRSHIRSLFEKLGVHSQVEAVVHAFRYRLI